MFVVPTEQPDCSVRHHLCCVILSVIGLRNYSEPPVFTKFGKAVIFFLPIKRVCVLSKQMTCSSWQTGSPKAAPLLSCMLFVYVAWAVVTLEEKTLLNEVVCTRRCPKILGVSRWQNARVPVLLVVVVVVPFEMVPAEFVLRFCHRRKHHWDWLCGQR